MAWTSANWVSQIGVPRLTTLRLHIQEVSQAITAAQSSGGTSYNPANLVQYLDMLYDQERKLQGALYGQPFFLPTRRRY